MTPTPRQNPTGEDIQAETRYQQRQIQTLEQDIHKGEKWLIILTAAMAFFALCGVIVGILQWHTYSGQLDVMRSTLGEMHNSGQGAIDQANKVIGNINWLARTMDGALQQNREAMKSSERQGNASLDASVAVSRTDQRAWVGVTGIEAPIMHVGSESQFAVTVTNSGKTPALDFRPVITGNSIYKGTEFKPKPFTQPPIQTVSAIFPGVKSRLPVKGVGILTAQQLTAISSGVAVLYVYGRLTYKDIFGTSHLTTFCFFFDADLSGASACENPEYNTAS